MAAWFDRGTSTGLDLLTFPLSTFPISIGAWVYISAVGIGTQCILTTSIASGGNYATVYVDNAGVWTVEKTGGGVVTNGNAVAGEWHYVLLRIISATSIRTSVWNVRANTVVVTTNTTVGAMTGFDTFSVGNFRLNGNNTNFMTGAVGELFITNSDCYSSLAGGGGQGTDNNYIKSLALNGPFDPTYRTNPQSDRFLEYRSFRSGITTDHGTEIVTGYRGMQDWTNQNGVLVGPHPPLPSSYVRPRPVPQLMMV